MGQGSEMGEGAELVLFKTGVASPDESDLDPVRGEIPGPWLRPGKEVGWGWPHGVRRHPQRPQQAHERALEVEMGFLWQLRQHRQFRMAALQQSHQG